MSSDGKFDIDRLSVLERLDLIAQLWESIPLEAIPVPDSHRQELERRLTAANADPQSGIPWEQARSRLREKR